MKEKYREVISYLICGVATTLVNLSVFWICSNSLSLSTAVSTAVAWVISVIFAYLTNKTFVFRSHQKGIGALRELGVFFGARVLSGVMEVILMVLLVDVLCLPSFWTKIGVGVFVTVWNYLFSKFFIFHSGHQKNPKVRPFLGIIGLITILIFLPMEGGSFFGSEGDWLSQHVAIADSLRQAMLSQKTILPQWMPLGAGSNSFDFAYYGLLRPDVLISCLLPQVPMKWIIAVYEILELYVGGLLCYVWLLGHVNREKESGSRVAFGGTVLFVSATCFYHAHHQIMFVNYMPFLMLALLGTDELIHKGKTVLLTIAVFFILIHSFYYGPAAICVLLVYFWYLSGREKQNVWKFMQSIFLAVGMSMLLLLPVACDILSSAKDGGSFAKAHLPLVSGEMQGLLYDPYGCGMSLLTLFCLLVALASKKLRWLSVVLLAVVSIPFIQLVLNGFLYARGKILIPFVPLFVLLDTKVLEEMWEQKGEKRAQRWQLLSALCCFLPGIWSRWRPVILAEGVILLMWLLWWQQKRKKTSCFWLILLPAVFVSLGVNASDSYLQEFCYKLGIPSNGGYVEAEDHRQEHMTPAMAEIVSRDNDYRCEILENAFYNVNVLGSGIWQKTGMYSSLSNAEYSRFFYDTAGNAISYNNRVALVAGKNPVFARLMGIRYLVTDKKSVPAGYRVLKEGEQNIVLAENDGVLPICYGTTEVMPQKEFEALDLPEALALLCERTIVETDKEGQTSDMQYRAIREIFIEEELERVLSAKTDSASKAELMLPTTSQQQILILRFHINRHDGQEVRITVNDVTGKWSSRSAPYPNKNSDFVYVLDGADAGGTLALQLSKGNYDIQNISCYSIPRDVLSKRQVIPAVRQKTPSKHNGLMQKALVYRGEITMPKEGWFVTSYPYKKGYELWIDGAKREPEIVNTAFLGAELSAGHHTVEIRFLAPGYPIGFWVSTAAWVCFGVCLCRQIYKTKEKRK